MLREDFEMTEPLNYCAVAVMPCELLVVSKAVFSTFVRDRALNVFKSNLITIHPDWVLRRSYINNQGWDDYKR